MRIRNTFLLAAAFVAGNLSAQTLSDYQSVVTSQGPTNYFKLDNSLESAVNPGVILQQNLQTAGGFTGDVFRNPTNSYYFVNSSDFLQGGSGLINGGGVSNTTSTAKGSITLLFRALSGPNIGGQRFLFDATTTASMGTTNHNALALYFENDTATNNPPNSLVLRFGDSSTAILQATNVAYGSWYYFALTYDEAREENRAIWYLGVVGTSLSTGMTTNAPDAVAGEGTGLIIGNRAGYTGAYRSPGSGRIDEFAIWARELSSTEISNQFAKLPQPAPPGGTYEQVVDSQLPKYYFKLDDSLAESVGNTLALSTNGTEGAFTTDFLGNPNWAYSFSNTNDALYITNDLISGGGSGVNSVGIGAGTISFQFRMLSNTNNEGQRFIFAAPATETGTDNNAFSLFLENTNGVNPNSLKLRAGGTTFGNSGSASPENNVPVAYATNLVPNAWYYFAVAYDESGNGVLNTYFGPAGGTLIKHEYNPNNNDSMGDNGPLTIGNRFEFNSAYRNPGNGVIDEFAIWHDQLSDDEIAQQFAAMTDTPASPPTLGISRFGNEIILSWPSGTDAGYVLESASVITSTTWTNAGSPTVVGTDLVVTNVLSTGTSFYRLSKP